MMSIPQNPFASRITPEQQHIYDSVYKKDTDTQTQSDRDFSNYRKPGGEQAHGRKYEPAYLPTLSVACVPNAITIEKTHLKVLSDALN
jgi:hypothetical protein